ncbi:hypothetical protein EJ08DRAFT_699617 [Tothia fuscella]|uniref:Zn(2)-C6 fungal-type domain-containing protein n=1 Tax=Tothia fuscella TaxID=1048955 RepID=A0A9P4NMQ1_9PEZI|nr:hypothetical protein EJ08DRAFT_699617 [Tothia fuscella]
MLHISNLTPDSFQDGAEKPEVMRPRKRQRKVLSCDSCHKQKVKCDREQPCSRCIAGNRVNQCTYNGSNNGSSSVTFNTVPTHLPSPANSEPHAILPKQPPKAPIATIYRKGRACFSGLTHWAQLAFKVEEAAHFIHGDPRELATLVKRMKNLKHLYPPKIPRPFPFGDSGASRTSSALDRLSYLPDRQLAEQLIDSYSNTFDRSFPLLDPDDFRAELTNFWVRPDTVSDAWLSQLYMILALGCYSSPNISFQDVVGGASGLAERFIDGAEMNFMARNHFMTKPDLTSLRVLCLLCIGKQMDMITLDDSDGAWVFMGFVMRIGMSMCLHIGPAAFDAMPKKEAMARRRIWNTMILLESTTALDSGMPLFMRPDDYDSSSLPQTAPQSRDSKPGNEAVVASALNGEYYQNLLAEVAPVSAYIINKANSTSPRFGREKIQEYDQKIRHLLRKAEFCITTQKTVIEVVLHRCLLAMHQSCSINPDNHCIDPEQCRWTSHESALGLLKLQNILLENKTSSWLGDFFIRDFGVAGLNVCVGLRNKTFDDTQVGSHSKSVAKELLYHVPVHIQANLHRSRHYFKMFKAYTGIVAALEALDTGHSIRDALYEAGLQIIETVENVMGVGENSAGLNKMVDPMLQLNASSDFNYDLSSINFPFDEFLGDFFWAP